MSADTTAPASRQSRGREASATSLIVAPRVQRLDHVLLSAVGSGRGFGVLADVSGLSPRQVAYRLARLSRTVGPVVETEANAVRLTPVGGKLVWAAGNFFNALDGAANRLYNRTAPAEEWSVVSLRVSGHEFDAVVDQGRTSSSALLFDLTYEPDDGALCAVAGGRIDAALVGRSGGLHRVGVALRAQTVLRESLVVSVPVGHPLAQRDEVSITDLRDVEGLVCGLRPDALAAAPWAFHGHGAGVRFERTPSVARQLARHERRPLISWPVGGLGSDPGWRSLLITSAATQTLRLVTDAGVLDAALADSVTAHLQDGHRALARGLSPVIENACHYPEHASTPPVGRPRAGGARRRGPLPVLDIDDYCLLAAIRDAGSINRAACTLRSSQSVVSRRVQHLENALGCTVVNRSSTGARLVRPIESLVLDVEAHAQRLGAVLQEIGERSGAQSRRVGTPA